MANEEHLAILSQGVTVWNTWRYQPPPSLADLSGLFLSDANLSDANLSRADLSRADLGWANLSGANLSGARLIEADFSEANLSSADLSGADLGWANLSGANLGGADLTKVRLGETVFGNTELKDAKGLETCMHIAASVIDYRTLARSGPLPLAFLRGCGLPDNLIDYLPSLLSQPIQFYSCFISYSSKDDEFARRLYADLQDNGVRCWFAPEDLKIGDRLHPTIDTAIRVRDKLLLILSESSVASAWVTNEVKTALDEEERSDKTVLFPVRLDDAVFNTTDQWAYDIKRSRHIGDFTRWKEHDAYQESLERLLRDLKVEREQPRES